MASANNGMSRDDEATTQEGELSTSQLAAISVTQLVQGIQVTLPFTIAVYMVRQFQHDAGLAVVTTEDEQRVARMTGVLAACFQGAQFFTSFALGKISDKIGRKPVFVLGNIACTVSMLGFGLSGSYGAAAACRFAGGLLNGIFGALKTMIADSCHKDGQAKALSAVSLSWGLGTIVAPAIGGVFSEPCHRFGDGFPLCAPGRLLQRRPYFLPCLIASLFTLVATILSMTLLNETLPGGAKWKLLPTMTSLRGCLRLSRRHHHHEYKQVAVDDDDEEHGLMDNNGAQTEVELVAVSVQNLEPMHNTKKKSSALRRFDSAVSLDQPHSSPRHSDGKINTAAVSSDDVSCTAELAHAAANGWSVVRMDSRHDSCASVLYQQHHEQSTPHDCHGGAPDSMTGSTGASIDFFPASGAPLDDRGHRNEGHQGQAHEEPWDRPCDIRNGGNGPGDESCDIRDGSRGPGDKSCGIRDGGRGPGDQPCDIWDGGRGPRDESCDIRDGGRGPRDEPCDIRDGGRGPRDEPCDIRDGNGGGNLEWPIAKGVNPPAGKLRELTKFVFQTTEDGRKSSGVDSAASMQLPPRKPRHLSSFCDEGDSCSDAAEEDALLQRASSGVNILEEYPEEEVPWKRNVGVYITLGGYSLIAFLFSFLDEGTPLFAAAPVSEGGLGWSPEDLALPLAFGGACLMLFALLCYPRIQKRLGVITTGRLGLALVLPLAQLAPLASLVDGHVLQQIVMFLAIGLRTMAGTMAFTSSMIMVNLTAPKRHIGEINGVGQTLAAFVRAVGPAASGLMWSASLQLNVPGHQFLLFIFGGVVAFATQFLYRFLKVPGLQ